MYTVKDMAKIARVSIRSLRYYDEIGLLAPTQTSEAGYRLYDDAALGRLMEILFYRQVGMPLKAVGEVLAHPERREAALRHQRERLERKRNHLNGLLQLLDDTTAHADQADFRPITQEDAARVIDHGLSLQSEESKALLSQRFGSLGAYREQAIHALTDPAYSAQLIRLYGSKDRLMAASLGTENRTAAFLDGSNATDAIYRQLAQAQAEGNNQQAMESICDLEENHKALFRLDSARCLLLELADHYLSAAHDLGAATDRQYGPGTAAYIGRAIRRYYGVEEG